MRHAVHVCQHGPHEHSFWDACARRAEIEQPMHTINEVDVNGALILIQRLNTLCAPSLVRMRCSVTRPLVRLHLGDHRTEAHAAISMDDEFSEKIARHYERRSVKCVTLPA